MSEFYTVKVRTPGKKVFFRNRVVRSPVELSTKEDKSKEKISVVTEPLIEELGIKSTLEDF